MEEVNRQILSERNRKIAERVKRERRREYHRRILNVALPLEVLSETDEEMVRPPTTLSDRSASVTSHRGTLARTASNKSVLSLPRIPNSLNPEKSRTAQPMEVQTSFTLYHPIGLVIYWILILYFCFLKKFACQWVVIFLQRNIQNVERYLIDNPNFMMQTMFALLNHMIDSAWCSFWLQDNCHSTYRYYCRSIND